MWSTLRLDIRHAFRSMSRQPVFTLVIVATLALGIGANTAMFALIHSALLKPLPYKDPGRLVLARRTLPGAVLMWNSAPDYYDYREQTTGFEVLAATASGAFNVLIRSTLPPARLTEAVQKLVAARDPEIPVDPLVRMDDIVAESLAPQRVTTVTLTTFSLIALLLASLGLYGVLTHYVAQRKHEIGVRMALGADAGNVVAHLLRRSALMVLPGLAVGLLVSLAGTKLIDQFLYGVPPTDPVTFAGVCTLLLAVAFGASAWPAWRAGQIDPVKALRGE